MAARWLLWIYIGVTATVIVVNLASPATMHFSDVLEVGPARGRVRVPRIRDRARIRTAPQTGLRDRTCWQEDR